MTKSFSGLFHTHGKALAGLFFLLLALVGFLTCGDYGLPCDQLSEQVILRENMLEYAYQLGGGQSTAVGYYEGQGVQRISQSIEKDHGQSAYYLFAPLLPLAETVPHTLSLGWQMYTWMWFMAGCWAIYGFCREMGQTQLVSCLCVLLLYLSPRFFAEGHYNNKDVVLLSLVLLTLWLGLRLLRQPGFLRGLLFSLAGALAANTKIVGALGWGLASLAALVLLTARKEWTLRTLGVALCTAASFLAFYALLTPALWSDPIAYLQYLLQNAAGFTRWPGVVVFRGTVVDQAVIPLPRIYLPYMMLTTLPLYTLPLAAVGQLSALVALMKAKASALKEARSLMLWVITLAWAVPLLYALLARPLVYNGWRHFYFVYAGVVLLAGQGLSALQRFLGRKPLLACVGTGLLCLCFALTALGMALNHPFQYGYYNLLARQNAEADMELDYWDVSTVNAMNRLCEMDRDSSLPLVLGAQEPMSLFGIVHGAKVLPHAHRAALTVLEEESDSAPYLFSNTTYARIYGTPPPEGYHVLFTLESYGNILCTLYEKNP